MKKKKVLIIFILCVLVIGIPYMNVEIKTYTIGYPSSNQLNKNI